MLQIENTLVSLDVIEKKFCCDLAVCKGECCIEGDSGAPLEEKEKQQLEDEYSNFKPYMTRKGIEAVEKQGLYVIDNDGDLVTPLVDKAECAFMITENGCSWCAIEKAYFEGKTKYRKPVSCQLYPIRITEYEEFDAVNYDQWKICKCARLLGNKKNIPVYKFLKDALIRKYGEDWYKQLEYAAEHLDELYK